MNQASQAIVPPDERRVLMELFAATGGERWKNRDGWGASSQVCTWYGVFCDFVGGDANRPVVAGLDLTLNNLEGTLPPSLSELSHLQHLRVAGNRLSGPVPEDLLQRWDAHRFEFEGRGNSFSNLVVRASVEYIASGLLCGVNEDLRYRVEFDEPRNHATLQSVRCANTRSRETYCLVREGTSASLGRLSRSLGVLGFAKFQSKYDYPYTFATHGVYLTTAAAWGDGSKNSVESYDGQGPIEVWTAQQLFLGLLAEVGWERESRKPKCDFQR